MFTVKERANRFVIGDPSTMYENNPPIITLLAGDYTIESENQGELSLVYHDYISKHLSYERYSEFKIQGEKFGLFDDSDYELLQGFYFQKQCREIEGLGFSSRPYGLVVQKLSNHGVISACIMNDQCVAMKIKT